MVDKLHIAPRELTTLLDLGLDATGLGTDKLTVGHVMSPHLTESKLTITSLRSTIGFRLASLTERPGSSLGFKSIG